VATDSEQRWHVVGVKHSRAGRERASEGKEMERGSTPAHCHTEIRPQPTWGSDDRRRPTRAPPPRGERGP
jgi:hypothetical protein